MDDITLYSTVMKLAPQANGLLPATQGRLAHGAFLDVVRTVDPGLSAALHEKNQRRPFTVSPLWGLDRPKNGQIRVKAGQEVWLRFTLLHSALFTTVARYLLAPSLSWPTLRLGELDFVITEMVTTPGVHPWAGYISAMELGQYWQTVPPAAVPNKITLEFPSGVVFSRSSDKDGLGKFMEFFPSPELLFGSVVAMWNEHTRLPFDKQAIREYARETVVVSAFDMKTKRFQYWGQPQIGAVGEVTYHLKDMSDPLCRVLNMLATFAFFSGVGAKTAMGLGQVRRKDDLC